MTRVGDASFTLPDDARTHVTIIGAGAIGVTAAYELIKSGCAVRIVDRLAPGDGCSFGNAGVFAAASAQPLASPKTMLKVPGYLIDPMGPLHIRLRHLPRLMPWLARFGWNGLFSDKMAATSAMHSLVAGSVDDYVRIASEIGAEDLIRTNGWVYAYNTEAERRANQAMLQEDDVRGFPFEYLDREALQARLPGISGHYIGADIVHGIGHTTNPARLVRAIADAVRNRGGEIVAADVIGIVRDGDQVSALQTSAGEMPVDQLVVAAGAYSAQLTEMLDEPLPLETERGYHAVYVGQKLDHEYPVMDAGLKAVVTPMEEGVRAAGTVAFASLDAPENEARARNVQAMAKRMYPALDETGEISTWLGRRPTLPDSLPVIDRARGAGNTVYAFGHQHVGLTGGPATARIVKQLVRGETPNQDIAPFRASRF